MKTTLEEELNKPVQTSLAQQTSVEKGLESQMSNHTGK